MKTPNGKLWLMGILLVLGLTKGQAQDKDNVDPGVKIETSVNASDTDKVLEGFLLKYANDYKSLANPEAFSKHIQESGKKIAVNKIIVESINDLSIQQAYYNPKKDSTVINFFEVPFYRRTGYMSHQNNKNLTPDQMQGEVHAKNMDLLRIFAHESEHEYDFNTFFNLMFTVSQIEQRCVLREFASRLRELAIFRIQHDLIKSTNAPGLKTYYESFGRYKSEIYQSKFVTEIMRYKSFLAKHDKDVPDATEAEFMMKLAIEMFNNDRHSYYRDMTLVFAHELRVAHRMDSISAQTYKNVGFDEYVRTAFTHAAGFDILSMISEKTKANMMAAVKSFLEDDRYRKPVRGAVQGYAFLNEKSAKFAAEKGISQESEFDITPVAEVPQINLAGNSKGGR